MPLVTSYQVILDDAVPFGGGTDVPQTPPYFEFRIPDVGNITGPAILAFKVDPKGAATLQVRLNQDVLLRQRFDTEPKRSWHETFSSDILNEENQLNYLNLSADTEVGGGSFTVSDIVLFFQISI